MAPCLFAALALWSAAARAQDEASWDKQETQHFVVAHQARDISLADVSLLERVYDAIHADLESLAPWMAGEKTKVYLYRDERGYQAGKFKPPAWSGGLFSSGPGEKAVAFVSPADTSVVAHELTHLCLHACFADAPDRLPPWLDEGLATMLQDEALRLPDPRDRGPVLHGPMPLARLFAVRPGRDAPGAWVSAWYAQAHSVVRFLKRGHVDASFADFCSALKSGDSVEKALESVYGYDDLAAFEADWSRWRPKKAMGLPVGLNDR